MKHRIKHNQLARNTNQAKALYQGLVNSVLDYGRVETTLAKAKAVSGLVDKVINLGKANNVNSRRQAVQALGNDRLLEKLFAQISPNFGSRNSGYTRVVRLGQRLSDGAERVILELVEQQVSSVKQPPQIPSSQEKVTLPEKETKPMKKESKPATKSPKKLKSLKQPK